MDNRVLLRLFVCAVFLIEPCVAFYIPGVAPLDFRKGEYVEVKVSRPPAVSIAATARLLFKAVKMTSTKTQLPYDYYDIAVHCKPTNGTKYKSENLGNEQRTPDHHTFCFSSR